MNYYFITGTSSGIGKALVELLLLDDRNMIYGFSRRNTLKHNRFFHTSLDLSKVKKVKKIRFPKIDNAERITLINNAGTLGKIKHLGNLNANDIITSFNVNITSLVVLCNEFINMYKSLNTEKTIVNISSGAAEKAYDGWGPYCSTKSGVNMITEVIAKEQTLKKYPIKAFAIAPGVVDTYMQDLIRESNENDFSNINKFNDLKSSGALYKAKDVAKKIISYCENVDSIPSLISRIDLK